MDRLRVSLSLWADILSSKDEIEGWSNSSVPQLAESISNLNNSLRTEELLKEFEVSELPFHMGAGDVALARIRKYWCPFLKVHSFFKKKNLY